MGSSFVLLPFLTRYMDGDELGLWYVFLAVAALTTLLQFGFSPTFARHISYCISGGVLTEDGKLLREEGVDRERLGELWAVSRRLFALIALVAGLLLLVVGTPYVAHVSGGIAGWGKWVAWTLFCVAILLNLYFLYLTTFLRGLGDVAGESKSLTCGRACQLLLTPLLLWLGCGLVGAASGYLICGVATRVAAKIELDRYAKGFEGEVLRDVQVPRDRLVAVFRLVGPIAARDGIVQLSNYGATQATSVACSLFLDLSSTASYSIMLQLGTALCTFSSVVFRSGFPALQSAYAAGDANAAKAIICKGLLTYLAMFALGYVLVVTCAFPLLEFWGDYRGLQIGLFTFVCLYMLLWYQGNLFCSVIVSTNEIPYYKSAIASSVLGIVFGAVLAGPASLGGWGLIAGQLMAQGAYYIWKWPKYALAKFGLTYAGALSDGFRNCLEKLGKRA